MGQCVSQSQRSKSKDINAINNKSFKINDFKFIKLIGKGGFSKVWKVQEKKTGKEYAIKVMDKAKIIAKKSVKAVIDQRKILTYLTQAGISFIANIRGSFQDSTKLYLLMDYLEGNTLRHHINYGLTLTEIQIKLLILALVRTLEYLYEHQIIHGDIKPQNILFNNEGVPFLTDFGSASFFQEDNSDENSGTIGYMAPQVMQCQSHNFAVDYYALGIITFQLFLKKRPYQSRNKQELLRQIRKKPIDCQNFPQLSTINPQAQDFIASLLRRKQYERLGYRQGIIQLITHPWLSPISSQINISNELASMNNIFSSQNYHSMQNQDEAQQSQQKQYNLIKYAHILQREHVQQMFQGFNSCISKQCFIPYKSQRKSSIEILQRLQTTHSLNKSLK